MDFVILGVYGWLVSLFEEQFGTFQNLSAGMKKIVNAVLGLVVPAVVIWLTPYWKPGFGELEPAATEALLILAPFVVWGVTQVWHYIELWLSSLKG